MAQQAQVLAPDTTRRPATWTGQWSLWTFTWTAIAAVLFVFVILEWAYGWFGPNGFRFNHGDLTIYTDATRRLFSGGSWFLDRQLAGPYPIAFGDVLYPPITAFLFAPWLVLPGWSFVVVPALIVAWFVWTERPSIWVYALIALCLLWPVTGIKVLSANPSIWVAAFVALGLRYRWPAALILLKPTFLPFALIGIRRRSWWIAAGIIALASLPFDPLGYVRVLLDSKSPDGFLYSWVDVPLALIPVIAWLAAKDRFEDAADRLHGLRRLSERRTREPLVRHEAVDI